jgi:cbb3-type cytochrome oxidase maturation protein
VSVIFIVLPVSILLAAGAVAAFVWAARGDQYDDTDTPAVRMLEDDLDDTAPGPARA